MVATSSVGIGLSESEGNAASVAKNIGSLLNTETSVLDGQLNKTELHHVQWIFAANLSRRIHLILCRQNKTGDEFAPMQGLEPWTLRLLRCVAVKV